MFLKTILSVIFAWRESASFRACRFLRRTFIPCPPASQPPRPPPTHTNRIFENISAPRSPRLTCNSRASGWKATLPLFSRARRLWKRMQRWVAAVEVPATPPRRITFTPVVLNRGLNTFFLVTGKDKREILAALRNESQPENQPVSGREAPTRRPRGLVPRFCCCPIVRRKQSGIICLRAQRFTCPSGQTPTCLFVPLTLHSAPHYYLFEPRNKAHALFSHAR